ncbi:MAG: hypothetical protein H6755_01175 [Candidatus Omnitrophica bacterium]|nr:hypothetical protein [Candidatus Omnitrophota bacterium]MCB9747002.1 hypothetical protein [Candidatus Omnitrophota bacterium]
MSKHNAEKRLFPLLITAVNTIFWHPVIFFPFLLTAFIQFFILEILYFSPREPLNVFFGPIISKIWSPEYLHYPLNLILLPKLFQYLQYPVFILLSSYLVSVSIVIIKNINEDKSIHLKPLFKQTFSMYVHIVVSALLSFCLYICLMYFFDMVIARAMEIRSQSGKFFILKRLILEGAPYFYLFFSVLITTLFAYVFPMIAIERKKVFHAIWENLKLLKGSFFFTFFVVLIPSLFIIPILILRTTVSIDGAFPEISVWILVLSICVLLFIDAVVYTALTLFYLMLREKQ